MKTFCIEINKEQPEWKVIQVLVQRSWRHTPFRNYVEALRDETGSSWRHTPFRNYKDCSVSENFSSWRHTPFRKT